MVNTPITKQALIEFLDHNLIGQLQDWQPFTQPSANTHYLLQTTGGDFILTIFDAPIAGNAEFSVELEAYLAKHDFPTATILSDKNNQLHQTIANKPCKLTTKPSGTTLSTPNEEQLIAIGDMIGRLHLFTEHYPHQRLDGQDNIWENKAIEKLLATLPVQDALLLQEELGYQRTLEYNLLPRGIIHADLFQDNILFNGNIITGILDFYYTCYSDLLLDLAIAANAWCHDENGHYNEQWAACLLEGYEQQRHLTTIEKKYWVNARRTAALKVWLARLLIKYFPINDSLLAHCEPDDYKNILSNLSKVPRA